MAQARSLVFGTRGSRLALRQTELVIEALRGSHPDLSVELREVRTEGDRRGSESLATIGGQGVFVRELEAALARRDVDVAVHSLKDVPADTGEALTLAAILPRADTRDALVARDGKRLSDLPAGARIGTGSGRRATQLKALRPDVTPVDIRGNVDTRVRKVDEGDVDAVVLAVAGLERLGLLERATEIFSPREMLPSVGQGAIAVQCRADDDETLEIVSPADDPDSRAACEAERAFMARLGGSCRLPFGALGTVEGSALRLRGFISDEAGSRLLREETSGRADEPAAVGKDLAERLLAQGAAEFVQPAETA